MAYVLILLVVVLCSSRVRFLLPLMFKKNVDKA